jgi:hypothetical protein
MSTHIRVYLFNESINYLNKNENIIKNIADDHKIKMILIKKKINSYFAIEGKYESVHKARIIIQDIEREYYKELSNNVRVSKNI